MKSFSPLRCPVQASLLAGVILLFSSPLLNAQAVSNVPGPRPSSPSFFRMIADGGFLTVLIWLFIALTSVLMVAFIMQSIISLRTDRLVPKAVWNSLRQTIAAGNYQQAWTICQANQNYLGNVLKAGLERLGRGKEAVREAVAEYGLREAQVIRIRNSYLSVIGVVAPMIGLLGTVVGMMRAFATLAQPGLRDSGRLAGNIAEVLFATAAGLFIAIPAFIAYYIFRNRAQMMIVYADDKVNSLIADLPYEELAGVRIGENYHAGILGGKSGKPERRKVSMALTTNCPVCNGAVNPGDNPCPHCGTTLQWT